MCMLLAQLKNKEMNKPAFVEAMPGAPTEDIYVCMNS